MLFRRRERETWLDWLRGALWPRRSWARSVRYAKLRLARLDASPHAIGLGLAIGAFVAFQPYLGFQMLFAGAMAWLLRASVAAALIGTFVGSPITWPVMWLASYHLGAVVLGVGHDATLDEIWTAMVGLGAIAGPEGIGAATAASQSLVRNVLYPLAVGAVPVGLMAGAAFYVMVTRMIRLGRR